MPYLTNKVLKLTGLAIQMLKCQLPWPHTPRRAGWLAQVRSEATCYTVSMTFGDVQAPLSHPSSALDQSMRQVNPGKLLGKTG